ncbi:MAG: hypothetical protein ACP5JR_06300 [Thermoplasmata archaeon]
MNGASMNKLEDKKGHEKHDKKLEHKIKPDETIEDVMRKIEELQKKYPDREFFLDGDEFAICSRPRKKEMDEADARRI